MLNRNRKLISLSLAVLPTVGLLTTAISAGADAGTGDINGDGKITVYDAQLLVEAAEGIRAMTADQLIAKAQQSWEDLLTKVKNANPNMTVTDGVYEITDAAGLFYMAKHPDQKYKLMNDVDLKGANWAPVVLSGSFDGNNKTISNVNITKGVKNSVAKTIDDQGFFAEIASEASVTNLTLKNIDIVASADAQMIGLLAGTNRGTVTGCYAEGSITDLRTEAPTPGAGAGDKTVIAALIARCVGTGKYTTVSVAATEPGIQKDGELVAAKLALNLADRADIQVCLCNAAPTGGSVQFQDITASYFATEGEKALQEIVVDYMYDMGTVAWIPTVTLTCSQDSSPGKLNAGTTYTGLPYNHMHGTLERFNYARQNLMAADAGWRESTYTEENGYNGWVRYMGNDCSGSIYQAWMRISPSDISEKHEGVQVNVTANMVPTDKNIAATGVQKVGSYTIPDGYVDYDGTNDYTASDTSDIWAVNKVQDMYNAFAQARKGDALVCWINGADFAEGHSRLIAEDPVVIRNRNGEIDVNKSYFITHEQGGRMTQYATSGVVSDSTWGINYKYPFTQLDADVPVTNTHNSNRCYLPVTIRALHKDTMRYTWAETSKKETQPRFLYSNYYIISATMTITDTNGNPVATRTVYNNVGTGERQSVSGARTGNLYGKMMVLEQYFGDIMAGQKPGTYKLQVTGTLSNGYEVDWTAGTITDPNGVFNTAAKLPATFDYSG